jgi:hypothetical protein
VKLDFENYRGNELEMVHHRPKIEAEKDETFSQYFEDVETSIKTIVSP